MAQSGLAFSLKPWSSESHTSRPYATSSLPKVRFCLDPPRNPYRFGSRPSKFAVATGVILCFKIAGKHGFLGFEKYDHGGFVSTLNGLVTARSRVGILTLSKARAHGSSPSLVSPPSLFPSLSNSGTRHHRRSTQNRSKHELTL